MRLFTCDHQHLTAGFTFEALLQSYYLTLGEWTSVDGSLIDLSPHRAVTTKTLLVANGNLEHFHGNSLATLATSDLCETSGHVPRSSPTVLVHINARELRRSDHVVPGSWEQIQGYSIPIMSGKFVDPHRVLCKEFLFVVHDNDVLKIVFDGDPIVLRHHRGYLSRLSYTAFCAHINPLAGNVVSDLLTFGERFQLAQ